MPKMAAIAAADDFLASHIGQLLVRQPQPKATEPAAIEAKRSGTSTAYVSDDSTARAKSTVSGGRTVTCDDSGDSSPTGKSQSALIDDDASQKLESLSLSQQTHTRERTSSARSSFATSFGAPPRRISISNARCSSIASETTSYFEHRRRRSMRGSHHSQISSPGFSPAYSTEASSIQWNMPFGDDSCAFATAVQQNAPKVTRHSCSDAVSANDAMAHAAQQNKSSSFSGPYAPQQRRYLAQMQSPKLETPPLHSPPLSVCSSADAGPSAHSVKSGSSLRSHRRGPSLVPKANDGRTFTFVELSSDSEQSDYSPVSSSPQVPSQESSSPEPASPFTALVDPDSKPLSATDSTSAVEKEDASKAARTVKFAATIPPYNANATLAPPTAGLRVGRTRQITILPKDPRKPTLLERTMANERSRRQTSAEQVVLMNDRARAKSPVTEPEAKSRESDTGYDPIEHIQGARQYRLRSGNNDSGLSGSDDDAEKSRAARPRANSGAQGEASQSRTSERTNNWARDQTRFTSPPLPPSKAVEIPLPSSDEADALALPDALTSAPKMANTRVPLSNSHSSYSMSSTSPPSDMQDLRTPPSETYTALSSPLFELDEPAVGAKPPADTTTLTAAA